MNAAKPIKKLELFQDTFKCGVCLKIMSILVPQPCVSITA